MWAVGSSICHDHRGYCIVEVALFNCQIMTTLNGFVGRCFHCLWVGRSLPLTCSYFLLSLDLVVVPGSPVDGFNSGDVPHTLMNPLRGGGAIGPSYKFSPYICIILQTLMKAVVLPNRVLSLASLRYGLCKPECADRPALTKIYGTRASTGTGTLSVITQA